MSSGVMVWAGMLKKQNKTAAVARSKFIRMMQSFLHTDKPERRSVMAKNPVKSCNLVQKLRQDFRIHKIYMMLKR